jgi:hypothetical protein
MTFKINNNDDLLTFIKRDDVTEAQATKVVCTFLNVRTCFKHSKEEIIKATENYINTFAGLDEKPIFLFQKGLEFSIKDFF